jgi:hypothetical protein
MIKAVELERKIMEVTKSSGLSGSKKLGTTAPIVVALGAYDESVSKKEAQAEQAAYLYLVLKNGEAWLTAFEKFGGREKKGGSRSQAQARRGIILELTREAKWTLQQYPLISSALAKYAYKKSLASTPVKTATPLFGVYAHEGTAYKNLKAQGQFLDPGMPRFAPSASLLHQHKGHATAFNNSEFANLSFQQYMELDRLLGCQYKVLYLNKIERLRYMVAVEDGLFFNILESGLAGTCETTVEADLGLAGHDQIARVYACDRHGNLFVAADDLKDQQGKKIQLNHSSLLAGREVRCAGTISIKFGMLRGISNMSGHYKPDTAALRQLLMQLRGEGVDVDSDQIVICDQAHGQTTGRHYMQGISRTGRTLQRCSSSCNVRPNHRSPTVASRRRPGRPGGSQSRLTNNRRIIGVSSRRIIGVSE